MKAVQDRPTRTEKTVHITEYPLNWESVESKSTHELAIDREHIYVTGQQMDQVAKLDYSGKILAYYKMPIGSGPHGILIDNAGKLWVSLEFNSTVVQINEKGDIVREIDVSLFLKGSNDSINVAPHGIALDADGEHIWFTGKRTSTVGKFHLKTEEVTHYQLGNLGALPIFLAAGNDGTIWGTELQTSSILNISHNGYLEEYEIKTPNSRPIAIIPDPHEPFMWFTEEAGVKIGRINTKGDIVQYPIPALQKNDIVASLVFDREDNLWVQVYVDHSQPNANGNDYLIKFDKSIRNCPDGSVADVPFTIHEVKNKNTMMHRIKQDYDGNLWFTEMMTDTLGVVRFEN